MPDTAAPVKIKLATLSGPHNTDDGLVGATARLTLVTEDKYEVHFDLDVMALAMIALTQAPILQALKTLKDAEERA